MIDIQTVVQALRNHFFNTILTFEVSEHSYALPTIEIKLKPDKYVRNDSVAFENTFRPELLKVLKKLGITEVNFNNTGSTFWWSDK